MPIHVHPIEPQSRIVFSLDPIAADPLGKAVEIVGLLEEILPRLRAHSGDEAIALFAIDVAGSDISKTEFSSMTQARMGMWAFLVRAPHITQRKQDWSAAAANLLETAKVQRSGDSIWEDYKAQFSEAAGMTFATLHRNFVPTNTRFLSLWDMNHEVSQSEAIEAIIKQHGICPETEAVLQLRVTSALGQHGRQQIKGIRNVLQAHY